MYTKIDQCPVCSGQKFTNEIICKDYTVSGESFAIVSCNSCSLWITSPRPSSDELPKYYQSEDYISHTNKGNSLINILYKIVRTYTLRQKVNLVKAYLKVGTILDYGCGTGDFLNKCKQAGFSIQGIEPDTSARSIAEATTGSKIGDSISKQDKSVKVDFISLWHVLEHVEAIEDTIDILKKSLVKSGYMLIAVPNHRSYDAQIYQEHWAGYDVPRHLFHFNQLTINKLAKKHKLRLVDTKPQYFDSFYVSMLSEKYKNQGNGMLKGFLNGLKSNRWASKNHNDYSSLIYILQKP